MEQKISVTDGGYPNADIAVPSSLISVHPFLEDSRRNLWWCSDLTLWSLLPSFHANNEVYHILIYSHARNIVNNPALHLSRKRVAFACINHAFKVCRGYIELQEVFIPVSRCSLLYVYKRRIHSKADIYKQLHSLCPSWTWSGTQMQGDAWILSVLFVIIYPVNSISQLTKSTYYKGTFFDSLFLLMK